MIYQARQYGTVILALVTVLMLGLTAFLVASDQWLPALLIDLFLVLLLANFSWLTVEVHAQEIVLIFGLGLIRRRIPLSRVASVASVRNKWWYGWGIRLTPHGWMWNISGLDAVEIHYTDGKAFRIGTTEPRQLQTAITRALAADA